MKHAAGLQESNTQAWTGRFWADICVGRLAQKHLFRWNGTRTELHEEDMLKVAFVLRIWVEDVGPRP